MKKVWTVFVAVWMMVGCAPTNKPVDRDFAGEWVFLKTATSEVSAVEVRDMRLKIVAVENAYAGRTIHYLIDDRMQASRSVVQEDQVFQVFMAEYAGEDMDDHRYMILLGKCLRPIGDEIGWVYFELCQQKDSTALLMKAMGMDYVFFKKANR